MRDRPRHILDLMRMGSGVTVDELARALHLTRTTVINHLRSLMGEGLVKRGGLRSGMRRPSVVYQLTPNADRVFPQGYEEFLKDVLDEVSSQPAGIKRIVSGVSKRWLARDLPAVKKLPGAQRVRGALAVLSKRGFMPTLEGPARRQMLQQHNCPLRSVCATHPEVPEAIRRWMQSLMGTSLVRTACAAHGDDLCSYVIGGPVG